MLLFTTARPRTARVLPPGTLFLQGCPLTCERVFCPPALPEPVWPVWCAPLPWAPQNPCRDRALQRGHSWEGVRVPGWPWGHKQLDPWQPYHHPCPSPSCPGHPRDDSCAPGCGCVCLPGVGALKERKTEGCRASYRETTEITRFSLSHL